MSLYTFVKDAYGNEIMTEQSLVSPALISACVGSYLVSNPPSASWSSLAGKPDTFPPDAHLHANYADSTHVHDYAPTIHTHSYSPLNHEHLGVYEPSNVNIQAHVISAHAPVDAQKNSDITKGEIEAKLTGAISSHTHAGGSGNGYTLQVGCPNQATTTDSQTVYWGGAFAVAQQTASGIHRLYIPKSGAIKACYIYVQAGTAGTGENWTMNIRKNNTSNTLVQTLGLASATRVWSNLALDIAVVAGDYIEIQEVQPAWATNPANIRRNGVIYIE